MREVRELQCPTCRETWYERPSRVIDEAICPGCRYGRRPTASGDPKVTLPLPPAESPEPHEPQEPLPSYEDARSVFFVADFERDFAEYLARKGN